MVGQKYDLQNRLGRDLPEGLLADLAWLKQRGISRQMSNHYVTRGLLEQPARGVYRRPRGPLTWEQVVMSLQTQLGWEGAVGGRSALELQNLAHFLKPRLRTIHLYGDRLPPNWVNHLPLDVSFVAHKESRIFDARTGATPDQQPTDPGDARPDGRVVRQWGNFSWQMVMSSPERAILELLDELPDKESFHQVDKLFEGLTSLRPKRLQSLLQRSHNIKVNRLFFYFADRHGHDWRKHVDTRDVRLGSGKRMLVRGGRLDPTYHITVPGDLDAL
jgi:hypothetical protein